MAAATACTSVGGTCRPVCSGPTIFDQPAVVADDGTACWRVRASNPYQPERFIERQVHERQRIP